MLVVLVHRFTIAQIQKKMSHSFFFSNFYVNLETKENCITYFYKYNNRLKCK